jgi:hypothetical protein
VNDPAPRPDPRPKGRPGVVHASVPVSMLQDQIDATRALDRASRLLTLRPGLCRNRRRAYKASLRVRRRSAALTRGSGSERPRLSERRRCAGLKDGSGILDVTRTWTWPVSRTSSTATQTS